MRAVMLAEVGPPEALVAAEIPDPVPGDGQVLIDVEYANVTFVETQVRAGRPPHPAMLPALPAVLGNGVGGVVGARRVVAGLGGTGGYAERAVADSSRLIEVPDDMPMREAVALLSDGRTALGLMRLARPRPGETVLVEAAAGGVGTLLVQLAVGAGARVIAVAGGERKLALARELGAEVMIDYRDAGWASRVREQAGTVDVVFDGVGGAVGLAASELLGSGGRFCPFGMASGSFAPVSTALRAAPSSPEDLVALTRAALAHAERGRLRPVIGQEFALERAAAAHAAIENRETIGKTLLIVRR
ncbi:MAG TPA: zinc-binding dehydrogenase [Solirubrobacteraceae bacterium]|jgi:NADPH2:quinone reductase|nr:zinc-binding dehydrogenase [Solirubrobacteraceae bacterium]